MASTGKRTWRKRIEEESATSATSKGMKMLPASNQVGGTSSNSGKRKGKAQTHALANAATITTQNIAFEGLIGMECRKW